MKLNKKSIFFVLETVKLWDYTDTMNLSKIAAARVLIGSFVVLGILFAVPYHTDAVDAGPDWINGNLIVEELGDYERTDGDQYTVLGNVLKEGVTGYVNNGSQAFPNLVETSRHIYPTSVGYFDGYYALPNGATQWQTIGKSGVITSDTMFIPNPASSGTLVFTNQDAYAQSTPYMYYVSDWREMFGNLFTTYKGNIIRKLTDGFTFNDYTTLRKLDGTQLAIRTTAAPAYSSNGRWLYVNSDIGQLRVSLPDLNYKIIAPRYNAQYSKKSAISNSGRFTSVFAYSTPMYLYDTEQCSSDTARDCAKRDITDYLQKYYQGQASPSTRINKLDILGMKFISDSEMVLYVNIPNVDRTTNIETIVSKRILVKVDPGEKTTRYLALGDSFSSGEGTFNYTNETNFYTNADNFNLCHVSPWSYPYIVSANSKPEEWVGSVACSGARISNVAYDQLPDNKYMESDDLLQAKGADIKSPVRAIQNILPGYVPQASFVTHYLPNTVTLTIGGNDIGFGGILEQCLLGSGCFSGRDEREAKADEIAAMIPQWVTTLSALKEKMDWHHQRLYVVGYPSIVSDDNATCPSLSSQSERQHLNKLTRYLNEAIRIAAVRSGAQFIDVSDVFYGVEAGSDRRLCGDGPAAINGFWLNQRANTEKSAYKPGQIYSNESYHPNFTGHILLAQRVLGLTNNLQFEQKLITGSVSKPDMAYYTDFVGDSDDFFHEVYETADATVDLAVKSVQTAVNLYTKAEQSITGALSLHSDPVEFGSYTTDSEGKLAATITIPDSVEPGMHRLVFTYRLQDITHVAYSYILVIDSLDDIDGDGILNDDEICAIGEPSGLDLNDNGVDDLCDADDIITTDDASMTEVVKTAKLTPEQISLASQLQGAIALDQIDNPDTARAGDDSLGVNNHDQDFLSVNSDDNNASSINSEGLGVDQISRGFNINSVAYMLGGIIIVGAGILIIRKQKIKRGYNEKT